MFDIDSRMAAAQERVEQLERQQRAQENRDKEKKRKIDTRRKIIIGELISKHFDVSQFQPKQKQADTAAEFAVLDTFFSMVAKDKTYDALFQKIAGEKFAEENYGGNGKVNA